MGLDVDIVKFSKAKFDANVNADTRCVDFNVGDKLSSDKLVDYRRFYEVRDILSHLVGGADQCDFYELTSETLEAAKVMADEVTWDDGAEKQEFLTDIDRILTQTNFDTEVVALSWSS